MREMKIAYGSSCFAKVWSNKTITFDALCERLKNTIRTPETVEEYPKLSKAERDRAKDKGGMVGGWLKQGRRKAANVECRSMLTHDVDSAEVSHHHTADAGCVPGGISGADPAAGQGMGH